MPTLRQGEVWVAELDPTRGREQAGTRPVLVVSVDEFNDGPADLVVAVPFTRTDRGVALHVRVEPPEGGLSATSFAMCEAVRSISKQRLKNRWGSVSQATMDSILERLEALFEY